VHRLITAAGSGLAQREARARARVLLGAWRPWWTTDVPINHVVELDQAERAGSPLEPQQCTRFGDARRISPFVNAASQQRLHRCAATAAAARVAQAMVAAAGRRAATLRCWPGHARASTDVPAKTHNRLDTAGHLLRAASQVESRLAWLATQAASRRQRQNRPPSRAADPGAEAALPRPEAGHRRAGPPAGLADAELALS
jgi:D-serine deaminase-like pyridoxal phosphate-dependent protein